MIKRAVTSLLIISALVILFLFQFPAAADFKPLEVQKHVLDNGLVILTLEDHSAPLVTFQVHYRVGSRNERTGITGMAHLFEHMMFKGSKKYAPEEFDRIVQDNGGTLNAFTSTDNTTYFENFPSDKLELAMELESERMENLNISAAPEEKALATLTSEREVVRSERKIMDNSPYGPVGELLFATAFTTHPYQWSVIGWDSDLRAISLKDCQDFYRTYYAPNNAVMVIVGDFNTEKAVALAKKYFGHIKAQTPPPPVSSEEPVQRGERQAVYKKVAQSPAFFAGYHVPNLTHADYPIVEVLTTILSRGRSSRLYQRFIKTGKALNVSTYSNGTIDPNLLEVMAIAKPDGDISQLEKEVYEEIEKLREDPVPEEELEKAYTLLESGFLYGLQRNFSKGLRIGMAEVRSGDYTMVNKQLDLWRAVTSEDIMRVAKEYLHPDNRTVVTLVPISPEEAKKF